MSKMIATEIPKRRATTVKRIPLRPPQGAARPPTAAESRAEAFLRLSAIRAEVLQYLGVALDKHSKLRYDLKQYAKEREYERQMLSDFGKRLEALEKLVFGGVWAAPGRRTGSLAESRPLPVRALPIPMAQSPCNPKPLPDWRKETREAVAKLKEALPALASITQIAVHFQVHYNTIRNLMIMGKLSVVREGKVIGVTREAVAECVLRYGVPHQRRIFYGAAGIKEYPK